MIFLGEPRIASEGRGDWVVYHTGASPHDAGTVKKVRLPARDKLLDLEIISNKEEYKPRETASYTILALNRRRILI